MRLINPSNMGKAVLLLALAGIAMANAGCHGGADGGGTLPANQALTGNVAAKAAKTAESLASMSVRGVRGTYSAQNLLVKVHYELKEGAFDEAYAIPATATLCQSGLPSTCATYAGPGPDSPLADFSVTISSTGAVTAVGTRADKSKVDVGLVGQAIADALKQTEQAMYEDAREHDAMDARRKAWDAPAAPVGAGSVTGPKQTCSDECQRNVAAVFRSNPTYELLYERGGKNISVTWTAKGHPELQPVTVWAVAETPLNRPNLRSAKFADSCHAVIILEDPSGGINEPVLLNAMNAQCQQ